MFYNLCDIRIERLLEPLQNQIKWSRGYKYMGNDLDDINAGLQFVRIRNVKLTLRKNYLDGHVL